MNRVYLLETIEARPAGRWFWHCGILTTAPQPDPPDDSDWLTIPDLVEILGVGVSRVRRLIEDRSLLAIRRDGVLAVPAKFIRDGEPIHELKGTLVVLADSGYSDDESMAWLMSSDDSLGVAPIDALRAGRKAEVRRVAQALAF